MNKNEREILTSCVEDIQSSDDKIEPLERLYAEVKKLLQAHAKKHLSIPD